ncbi:MAG: hypothetical protein SBU_001435 [Candidatus Syntrophoarchaeum butanivorans]|uniref:Uncharacterized protein n=1 Tax=Candidatus Syntropharchaeum butanivorans TaxID=1839936 RepID=A0A1F2P361_9EURY|nr:MAG: hypothetical protein SBU_001435 [Candidatus Syntrophoarchaeum butanivorans]
MPFCKALILDLVVSGISTAMKALISSRIMVRWGLQYVYLSPLPVICQPKKICLSHPISFHAGFTGRIWGQRARDCRVYQREFKGC